MQGNLLAVRAGCAISPHVATSRPCTRSGASRCRPVTRHPDSLSPFLDRPCEMAAVFGSAHQGKRPQCARARCAPSRYTRWAGRRGVHAGGRRSHCRVARARECSEGGGACRVFCESSYPLCARVRRRMTGSSRASCTSVRADPRPKCNSPTRKRRSVRGVRACAVRVGA
jgi:hypothetical protein